MKQVKEFRIRELDLELINQILKIIEKWISWMERSHYWKTWIR